MSDKSTTDQYVEHINNNILPFIDYDKLQMSYVTNMVYAKGILNRLHEAMVSIYGSEQLFRGDGDDGFVVIPGVVQGKKSQNVCLALLDIDLSSSGEHWGTSFLCKYGVIDQDPKEIKRISDENSALGAQVKKLLTAYSPYDYGYTAIIPSDIHVKRASLPPGITSVLDDFQNHRAELENVNPLAAAEMSTEQNCNMIDGAVNNLPPTPEPSHGRTQTEPGERPSATDKLEAAKAEAAKQTAPKTSAPHKSKDAEL